jgi:hypothetical protein
MRIASEHDFFLEVHRFQKGVTPLEFRGSDPFLKREEGELLAQEPFEELGHLAEEARFLAASQGRLPDAPEDLTAQLLPLSNESDPPFLDGLRLHLRHRQFGQVMEIDFPSTIAGARAVELVAQLVAEGRLQEGDRYRVRLTAMPRGTRRKPLFLESDDASLELQEDPFPVCRRDLAAWGIESECLALADPGRPVFIHGAVVRDAVAEAIRHGNVETGKLLLGLLVEDPRLLEAGKATGWAVVVTEQVAVPEGLATASSFTYPPESFRQARQLAELRGHGEKVIGSQHSHGWRCQECDKKCEIRNLFFSTDDVGMAASFPVYAVFLVVGGHPERDRDRPVANLYVRQRGLMQAVPFGTFGEKV